MTKEGNVKTEKKGDEEEKRKPAKKKGQRLDGKRKSDPEGEKREHQEKIGGSLFLLSLCCCL